MLRLIALCGLHDAGKSTVAERVRHLSPGCDVVTKLEVLRALHATEATTDADWRAWYRAKYAQEGPAAVVRQVLDRAVRDLPLATSLIVLDAVHSAVEWQAVHERIPSALVLVATPADVRAARRRTVLDTEDDVRRLRFAHDADVPSCLFASADWVVPGSLGTPALDSVLGSFLTWFGTSSLTAGQAITRGQATT